jgi:hypothetical protein
VAVDVHARIGEAPCEGRHPAGPVVHLGEDRLTLDKGVAAVLEHRPRRVVVSRRHDHVAGVPDPAAPDCSQVHAASRQRLGKRRHGARLVLELDDELVGHLEASARGVDAGF